MVKSKGQALRAIAIAVCATLGVVALGAFASIDGLSTKASTAGAEIDRAEIVAPSQEARQSPAMVGPPAAASGSFESQAGTAAALAQKAERQVTRELRRQRAKAARLAQTPFSFVFASFNILGSNHTSPGSDADHFAPGRLRTEWAVDVISAHGMDIVGLSEIQHDQLTVFLRAMGSRYAVWPGTALGGKGIPQTVAWRTDRFTAVEKTYITIPFVGQQRPQPVVRLKERATGREFYVIHAHNAPNNLQGERNTAMAIEIAKIKELRSTQKIPVFFGGDLNEKENALCKVTTQTDLVAASPSGNLDSCTGFSGMRLDWLFGSNVTFSNYVQDRSPLVARITDHAVVVARATVN